MSKKRRKTGKFYDPNALLMKTRLAREEAAFLLDVGVRTIDLYMAEGKIEYGLTPGGWRRPLTVSVKKFL